VYHPRRCHSSKGQGVCLFVLFVSSSFLLQYAADWQPSKNKPDDKLDEVTDTFNQAVHLLLNLW
jgi:hypothetical protein